MINKFLSHLSIFFSSDGMHYVKYKYKKSENNLINMSSMFKDCRCLKTVDFSNFDISYVTNMSYMFYSCENFNKLILSKHKDNCFRFIKLKYCKCYRYE